MLRTRPSAAILLVLAMVAAAAHAQIVVDYGTPDLGHIVTGCFTVCFGANCTGSGTINSLDIAPPFFVRGIRIGPDAAGDDLCNNTPDVTMPATLPQLIDAGQRLAFDVDLVATQSGDVNRILSANGAPALDLMASVAPVFGCTPGADVECLQDDRFQVRTYFRTNFGTRGPGPRVPGVETLGSDDSGLFYFFDPDNWEMLLKVLDACSVPQRNRFWVFAAATTNVEYTITVTDTQTQQVNTYFKPQGPASPAITDTNAFATCP